MDILTELFKNVLNMTITGTIIAVAIILVRLVIKRFPKRFSYALWGILGIRLLCPFSISSVISLFNLLKPAEVSESKMSYVPKIPTEYLPLTEPLPPSLPPVTVKPEVITVPENVVTAPIVSPDPTETALNIAAVLWAIGLLVMVIYSVVSYLSVRKRVFGARLLERNIYICSEIETPFVYGIVKPRIYIPDSIAESDRSFIISHECVHISRCDHIIKLIALTALSLHWFNPLIWLSFRFMVKDMEMSCDERALNSFNSDVRKAYAAALLNISMKQNNLAYGGLLSFGESNIKSRIKGVLNAKRPALWVTIVGIIVLIIVGVCLLTNANESSIEEDKPSLSEEEAQPEQKKKLNLDYVKALSDKGWELDWEDFEEFEGEDIGSGMYVMYYPIDEEYSLYVRGKNLDEKPEYVTLKRKYQGVDFAEYDIRLGELKGFLEIVPTPTGTTEQTPEQEPAVSEYLYNDVKIRDEMGGSGIPHSYGELTDFFTDNMCFIEYEVLDLINNQEAANITQSYVYLDTSSLYIAHAIYDHLNDKPLDFYFYLCKVGVPESQVENLPPCEYGSVYVSAFSDYFEIKNDNPIYNELNFAVKYDENGNKYAYHIDFDEIKFIDKNGESLDEGLSIDEVFEYTTTSNNPVKYTKKIPFEKLTSFIREDFKERGIGFKAIETEVTEKEYDIEGFLSELDPRVREAVLSFAYTEAENGYFWLDYEEDAIKMDIPVITSGSIRRFNSYIVHEEENSELVLEDEQLVYTMCSYHYWFEGQKVTTAPISDEDVPVLEEPSATTATTTAPPVTEVIEEEEFNRLGSFKHNGYRYRFSQAVMDVMIMDENGIIFEPYDANYNITTILYRYNEYEYLGSGAQLGYGNEKTKLYLVFDGLVLAISPYPNVKKELKNTDWLERYPEDMIYAFSLLYGENLNPPEDNDDYDDINPGGVPTKFLVINGEKQPPFPEWSYFVEIDGKHYILAGGGIIHTPSYRIREEYLYNGDYITDIINNYEPTVKAVYDEKLDDEFDTNIDIMDGGDVYYFENSYFGLPSMPLLSVMITAEPQYIIDGVEVYRICEFYDTRPDEWEKEKFLPILNERFTVLSEIMPYLVGYAEPVTDENGAPIHYSESEPKFLLSDCKYSKSEIEKLLNENLSGELYSYFKELLDNNTRDMGGKLYFARNEEGKAADKIVLPELFPNSSYTVTGDYGDGEKEIYCKTVTASGEELRISVKLSYIDGIYRLDSYRIL